MRSWFLRGALVALLMSVASGCARSSDSPCEACEAPADLFAPLEQPYSAALYASRQAHQPMMRASVMSLLSELEALSARPSQSWPAPYRDEEELTRQTIELMRNQLKVTAALTITGDHEQSRQTLEELGQVLGEVRGSLGASQPFDQLMQVYFDLSALLEALEAEQVGWPQVMSQAKQVRARAARLQARALAGSCREHVVWRRIDALQAAPEATPERAQWRWLVSEAQLSFEAYLERCRA